MGQVPDIHSGIAGVAWICRRTDAAILEVLILMLFVIAAAAVAANRLKIPPAILLVITGVVLAVLPGLPAIDLSPDLVLLLVLPPIIYSSAVAMSWCDFRFNLRPITLLAVGCVLFTTTAVAAATHWMLGLSWQIGFLLGAIVSPPDAVAPLAIARRLEVLGGCSSFSRAKASPTMRPPWCCTGSPWPP